MLDDPVSSSPGIQEYLTTALSRKSLLLAVPDDAESSHTEISGLRPPISSLELTPLRDAPGLRPAQGAGCSSARGRSAPCGGKMAGGRQVGAGPRRPPGPCGASAAVRGVFVVTRAGRRGRLGAEPGHAPDAGEWGLWPAAGVGGPGAGEARRSALCIGRGRSALGRGGGRPRPVRCGREGHEAEPEGVGLQGEVCRQRDRAGLLTADCGRCQPPRCPSVFPVCEAGCTSGAVLLGAWNILQPLGGGWCRHVSRRAATTVGAP